MSIGVLSKDEAEAEESHWWTRTKKFFSGSSAEEESALALAETIPPNEKSAHA